MIGFPKKKNCIISVVYCMYFPCNFMLITYVLTKKMLVQHTVTYCWKKHVLSITQNLLLFTLLVLHVSIILFYFCEEPTI